MKKTQERSILIYDNTTKFLVGPDLERSLTKTRKELLQAPSVRGRLYVQPLKLYVFLVSISTYFHMENS